MTIKTEPSITQNYTDSRGVEYLLEYFDADSFDGLNHDRCKQVYGVCFVEDKIVIGYGGMKRGWGLIGGSVEVGETLEETLSREIQEESNMEVLSSQPIGYQKVTDVASGVAYYQLRYMCEVRKLGEFIIDGGDGASEKGITEIKLIDPDKYKDYFDWGDIGERVIRRAIELYEQKHQN
jgi:ADP-ribose pyrophosphatase YjhB (NUDIX family)